MAVNVGPVSGGGPMIAAGPPNGQFVTDVYPAGKPSTITAGVPSILGIANRQMAGGALTLFAPTPVVQLSIVRSGSALVLFQDSPVLDVSATVSAVGEALTLTRLAAEGQLAVHPTGARLLTVGPLGVVPFAFAPTNGTTAVAPVGPAPLPVDDNVLGYWRMDEVNAADPITDATGTNATLTVAGLAPSQLGKIGGARYFSGIGVFAFAAPAPAFAQAGRLTLMAWASLEQVNSLGSKLRTIIACDGPTSSSEDAQVFALGVADTGALDFRYASALGPVVVRTAPAVFRTGRMHHVAVTREVAILGVTVRFLFNGAELPVATVTVNGVSASPADPLPPPVLASEPTATVKIGRSDKALDSYWFGALDEVSVHNVTRSMQPYVRGEFLRHALNNATFERVVESDSIRAVDVVNLPNGARWWCYERESDLFVVREAAPGLFEEEIQLTTAGLGANGAPVPAGARAPALAYNSASDTITVMFESAGRAWVITANSADVPATQNMPFTADTTGIIKARDTLDKVRVGGGATTVGGVLGAGLARDVTPAAPTIFFIGVPSFGVAIVGANPDGYEVYRELGGAEVHLGTAQRSTRPEANGTYHFFPLVARIRGAAYRVRPIQGTGRTGTNYSNVIVDWLGEVVARSPYNFDALSVSRDGDLPDSAELGAGQGAVRPTERMTTLNRTPLKMKLDDGGTLGGGGGQYVPAFTTVNRVPVKMRVADTGTFSGGGGTRCTIRRTNERGVEK